MWYNLKRGLGRCFEIREMDYDMLILQSKYLSFVILLMATLSGCSSSYALRSPIYSIDNITKKDLLSGEALFGDKAHDIILPEDHVMSLDEDMKTFVDKYLPRNMAPASQVRNLMSLMLRADALNMKYDATKTYTAHGAFKASEGNCLSFSYLFTVLARERGLRVSFQEVAIPSEWDPAKDTFYYVSRHVNVRISMQDRRDLIIDIDRINYKPHYESWKISDKNAVALYYSNKGADYIIKNNYENAFRYLVKAIELSPKDASIWSNLGILYRLKGMYNYAEKAYFIALKFDSVRLSVFNNLVTLYDQVGDVKRSEYYKDLTKKYQMGNPYYRYYKALDAFDREEYDIALGHLKKAIKKRNTEKMFFDLLAQTYRKLGDDSHAEEILEKARKL
ncbi:MAG: hypothetical protein K9G26_05210 [Emcibacter sp.]|nr:hypothetical protein [Emcibacter sp.]